MSFSVITYSGVYPVDGSYDPVTHIFNDLAPVVTHRLVSQRLVIPYSTTVSTSSEYMQAINNVDWVAGGSGYSTITIPATTHGLSSIPDTVNVFLTVGSDIVPIGLDAVLIDSTTHDVVLRITTGDEFTGRVVIKT